MSRPSMSVSDQRRAVVAEALSWVGTPYHNGGDIKQVGVDCGMLLVRVFVDTGFVEPFDPRPYPAQWHLHQFAERYLHWIETFGQKVPGPDEGRVPFPGDVVMFKYGHTYAHGSIVIEWPMIVHAMGPYPVSRAIIPQSPFLRRLPKLYYCVKSWLE